MSTSRSSEFNMRKDCIYYESRTYKTGETVRKCRLKLAPNAPFECPKNCAKYTRRKHYGTWDYGSFTQDLAPETYKEQQEEASSETQNSKVNEPGSAESISNTELLAELELIVNEAAPDVIEEVKYSRMPWYKKIFKRNKHGRN